MPKLPDRRLPASGRRLHPSANNHRLASRLRRLFIEPLERRALLATITAVAPAANSFDAASTSDVTATFDQAIDAATVTVETFAVHATQSEQTGAAAISVNGNEIRLDPTADFRPGELIQATVTSGVEDTGGDLVTPFVWQFTTAATNGGGLFQDGNQGFGNQVSMSVALGDLDGDGDLDAFVGNRRSANRIWFNEDGQLTDSGQELGDHESFGVALGDLDGDGDLDAYVANLAQGNRIWLNDGGQFNDSGQVLSNRNSLDVALGDLDADGDLDAIVANGLQGNTVWLNEGGLFSVGGRYLGYGSSNAVALGDFDSDGDLDAFIANSYQANRVWINTDGAFSDSGQVLGLGSSRDVAIGDVDGDGDADAIVVNSYQPNRIWLNDSGTFIDSGQELGNQRSYGVSLGDLDADGDLDAFVANTDQGNRVWLNTAGVFADSGQSLGGHQSFGSALGDVDGDGDLDAFVVNSRANRVWRNLNPTISVTPRTLPLAEGDAGLTAFEFTVTRAFDTRGPATVDFAFTLNGDTAAQLADFANGTLPSGTLTFADGESSLLIAIDVVGDTVVEDDETFSLVLSNPAGRGAVLGVASAEATIRNDDGADLGDLPLPFPTLFSDNGPAHIAVGPMLGAARDIDVDGLPSVDANGDDFVGEADEDGVVFAAVISAGQLAGEVTVNSSGAARLDAWIDFNGDHSFDSAGEQIFTARDVAEGDNQLTFMLPGDSLPGGTFARFRLSTQGGLAPTGGSTDGEVEDYVFVIANPGGSGVFGDSQQTLGNHSSLAVELGDLDGDGDLDAFTANGNQEGNQIWLNENGAFTNSGQGLGDQTSNDVALGDLDGDGDLDAFVANATGNRVWINDGGILTANGQELGSSPSYGVSLGDLDRDGDLDAFVTNASQGNRVWSNDGNGGFTAAGPSLGNHNGRGVELGDLDGDGDLDALVVNYDEPNRIWLNDAGVFSDSGQELGDHRSWGLALGDVDGDGDLDAFVTNVDQDARLWLNQYGTFRDTNQTLGDHFAFDVALADLDGDGDLDAFLANGQAETGLVSSAGNRVLLNTGGSFRDFGQPLGDHVSFGVALGDLDGDGDIDAFSANYYQPIAFMPRVGQGDRVWLNLQDESLIAITSATADLPEGDAGSTAFVFDVNRVGNISEASSVSYSVSGSGSQPADAADFGGSLPTGVVNFAAGEASQTIQIDVLGDAEVELDEHFIVTLSEPQPVATEILRGVATGTIRNDDLTPITVFLTVDNTSIVENLGVATFSAVLSAPATSEVTVELAVTGSATPIEDYTVSGTQIVIPVGASVGEITVVAVQDDLVEDPETVSIEITSVTNAELGTAQQTTTITDDDEIPQLFVTSLSATESRFAIQFSTRITLAGLNVYDAERAAAGPADVTLVGAQSGPVAGTVLVHPSRTSLTFIKTGGPLEPDVYTVTLRSASDGLVSDTGLLLDGNEDGNAGDDYVGSFTITPPVASALTLSIPDFTRGPGQPVELPADGGSGIPLVISGGGGARTIELRIQFETELLQLTSVELGEDAPAGSTVALTTAFGGAAMVTFTGAADLPAGANHFATLQAIVPAGNASEIYNSTHILELHRVTVRDVNDRDIPVIEDDGVHVVSFLADVSGNGRLNASDAARVARIAALLDTGFDGSLLVDPIQTGDVSGNGRINSADASLVAQAASLLPVPEIPELPGGVVIALGGVSSLSGHLLLAPNVADDLQPDLYRLSPIPLTDRHDVNDLARTVPSEASLADQALEQYLNDAGGTLQDGDDSNGLGDEHSGPDVYWTSFTTL